MNCPRIVMIGAGSHFTLGLFGDLLRVGDLWGSELILMDIDEEKLRIMERILRRFIEEEDIDVKIAATTNLDEALENADFVITSIRYGGLEALKAFINIPLKLGAVEVVGDTVGPSGVLKGVLEIPAILNIAQKVEDKSPKAILMNFTNPMTPVCRAVRKSTKVRIVGLCHGCHHIRALASKLLGLRIDEIGMEGAGINHLTWTTDITHRDESVYEDFLESLLMEDKERVLREHPYLIGRDLYRVFGVPPTLSDRHTSEFFHYLYDWMRNPIYGPILRERSGYIDYEKMALSGDVVRREEERRRKLLLMAEGRGEVTIRPSREYALDIASAITHKRRLEVMALNIENQGAIDGIEPSHIVEAPAVIEGGSIKPAGRFKLPESVVSILNQHLEKFEVMVEGILEEDKNLLTQAIALDPLTPSPDKAEKILNNFIENPVIKGLLSNYDLHLT
ncbi:hypothetical protein DRO55_05165 [Candidatus Bathyarchaeota archaeon]|nr:MAG: hypothetical protein DRO55_05165 [Candidatus Bathyarchaeota archaeon]